MEIVLYHTTDLHGYVYPTNYVSEQNLGLLKIGSYMLADQKNYDGVLKVDCGDLIQGSPLTHYLSKQNHSHNVILDALAALDYDAYVLGNHEFNYGFDYLYNAYRNVNDKIVNANIDGLAMETKPYQIFDFDGFKIGIIGLTTAFIPNWEQPENIDGIDFIDPVAAYAKYEAELKAQTDFIIVAYHGGFEKSVDTSMVPTEKLTKENQGSELLETFDSIDMMLTGHQHRSFMSRIGDIVCSQPLNNGQNFGKIVIDTQTRQVRAELVETSSIVEPINPELEAIFTTESEKLAVYLDQKIGTFAEPLLVTDIFQARVEGHPFVNFLHQVQREMSGADLSATSLFDGTIGFDTTVTIRDVIVNYPYPNTLVVLRITGEAVKEAIEKAASYYVINEDGKLDVAIEFIEPKKQHYNYDMFGGLNYEIDVTQPVGARVTLFTSDNQPFDFDRTYTIAMNNYRASNTAIYSAYENAEIAKTINLDIGEVIMDYFQTHANLAVDHTKNYKVKY